MRTKLLLVVMTVVTILALGTMAAWSADGDLPRRDGDQITPEQRWQTLLDNLDADHDGKISKEEFTGPDEAFDRLDADGDGFVAAGEAGGRGGGQDAGGNAQRWQAMWRNADKNGDGAISEDEWPGKPEMFEKLDRNGDGVIGEDEQPKFDRPAGDGPPRRGDQVDPEARWQQMLERFDGDDDGQITEAEFQGPDKVFDYLDRNGDGVITADEGKAAAAAAGGGRQARDPVARFKSMLEQWDANGDGQLSRDEWQGREEQFAQLDNNGDGIITEQEFADAMAQMMRARNPVQGMVDAIDTDADGRMSEEEWAAFFAAADANGDGFLSQDELMKALRPPRPDGPAPAGPRDGDAPPPAEADQA